MSDHDYDLAVTFAGEQRTYVSSVVAACKSLGLRVFYDKDRNNDWWGKSYIREQRLVYSSRTRFVVPFISTEYLSKPVPMDEFSAAMMTAVKQGSEYILPVLIGDPAIPPDLLHQDTHYLRAENYTAEGLAHELQQKVAGAANAGQELPPIGEVVENAMAVRLPKIVPTTYSKYEQLDKIYQYLIQQFGEGISQLKPQGLVGTVRPSGDSFVVRIERAGETVAGINVSKGRAMGDDKITWSVGYRQFSSNSFNGWAAPKFDKGRGEAVVEIFDMGSTFGAGAQPDGSYEGLFTLLWGQLIEQVER